MHQHVSHFLEEIVYAAEHLFPAQIPEVFTQIGKPQCLEAVEIIRDEPKGEGNRPVINCKSLYVTNGDIDATMQSLKRMAHAAGNARKAFEHPRDSRL